MKSSSKVAHGDYNDVSFETMNSASEEQDDDNDVSTEDMNRSSKKHMDDNDDVSLKDTKTKSTSEEQSSTTEVTRGLFDKMIITRKPSYLHNFKVKSDYDFAL